MTQALVTFQVRVEHFDTFKHEFAKLARKAAKLGVGAPAYEIVESNKVVPAVLNPNGTVKQAARVLHIISVSGQAPKIAGWTFLASLQHEPTGNIVRRVPGMDRFSLNPALRTADPKCDHCHHDRKRNDTYVLVHDDGRQAQVGRTCLKDFTGHESPETIARWAELLGSFVDAVGARDDEYSGGSSERLVESLASFLPFVVASIRINGWVSRTAARDRGLISTASEAWESIHPHPLADKSKLVNPTDADESKAAQVCAYIRQYFESTDAPQLSDYEHNLRIIVEGGSVDHRTIGLAASIVSFVDRQLGNEIQRKRLAERPDSVYVGTVGKRETFTLTVEKIVDLETAYGVSHLHIMADAAGNSVKWFSSSVRLEERETYSVKGTVKSHDLYEGRQQTMMTRCKASLVEKAAA